MTKLKKLLWLDTFMIPGDDNIYAFSSVRKGDKIGCNDKNHVFHYFDPNLDVIKVQMPKGWII
jgi:hypothetical protein